MEALRSIYGYRNYAGRAARALTTWLDGQAEEARSNEDLARRLVEECRRTLTVLPATTTIERLCADALVAAERRVEERIAARLDIGDALGKSQPPASHPWHHHLAASVK